MRILLANPRGFCAGVDRAIDIVERALESLRSGGVDLHFYQDEAAGDGVPLYTHLSRLREGLWQPPEAKASDMAYSQKISVGNQQWEVVCIPASEKYNTETWTSIIIIVLCRCHETTSFDYYYSYDTF